MSTINPPLLEIDDIEVSYLSRTGQENAVSGVSLTVEQGEFVTVVGESGSGKSTLIQTALGLLPKNASVSRGKVRLWEHDITGLNDDILAQIRGSYVSFVPQDPATSLNPVKRVGRQVEDAVILSNGAPGDRSIQSHRLFHPSRSRNRDDIHRRALEALTLAGLSDAEKVSTKYPHELSGGMRQRVLIAIALAGKPRLIIADEPTSALDVTVQKGILDHLKSLQHDLGLGILLVTHDIGVALERSDRIIVLRHGKLVEEADPHTLYSSPTKKYTRELLTAAPSIHSSSLATTGSIDVPAVTEISSPEIVLRGDHLTRIYSGKSRADRNHGGFTALNEASIAVRRGRTHAVVGESGAGKSTLARILAGFDQPTSGTVELNGRPLTGASRSREIYRNLQYVLQNPFTSLDPRFTVRRIIAEPLRAYHAGTRQDIDNRVREVLNQVQLPEELIDRRPAELSGGQRQRVAIARAISIEPEIIILDEAVSALDVSVQGEILQLLADLQERLGLSYLFITHDLGVVRQIAHDVSVMKQGRIVETGSVDNVFRSPSHPYSQALLDAVTDPIRELAAA